jgi:hypothetical protein
MIPQSLCRVAHVHNMRAYAAETKVVRDDDVNGTACQRCMHASSSELKFGWELRQLFRVDGLMGHVVARCPAIDPVHACMACTQPVH